MPVNRSIFIIPLCIILVLSVSLVLTHNDHCASDNEDTHNHTDKCISSCVSCYIIVPANSEFIHEMKNVSKTHSENNSIIPQETTQSVFHPPKIIQ